MAAAMFNSHCDGNEDIIFQKVEELPMERSHLVIYQVNPSLTLPKLNNLPAKVKKINFNYF